MKVFTISDGYKTVFVTEDSSVFYSALSEWVKIMKESLKNNTYIISNTEMTEKEYEVFVKNLNHKSKEDVKYEQAVLTNPRNRLKLIKGGLESSAKNLSLIK